ncbi:hypothetical protein [Zavarzinella formosa]|uniref:hypothetical protein n=1 Tax=Zavarzinella formosa TaxID=360055 RepID=UPI0002F73B21|nr:hypothetical protein [Zavarzinella formosa]
MNIKCILCNAEDGVCLVLSDCQSFHCKECGEGFDLDDVETRIKELRKMVCVANAAKTAAEKE